MIAVLVDARKPGSTGWAAVRSTSRIRVKGLACGMMEIHFFGNGMAHKPLNILGDGEFNIPRGATRLRVKLLEVGKGSRVFVDME